MLTDIGERLKNYRIFLGKTRKEFAQGVISDTYLFNVEHGEGKIRADHLIAILQKNNISISDFLIDYNDSSTMAAPIIRKVDDAFSLHDIQKLQRIAADYPNSLLGLVIQVMLAQLNAQDNAVEYKEKIRQLLGRIKEWNNYYLWALTHIMDSYNSSSLMGVMDSVFHNYQDLTSYNDETIDLLAKVTLNYLQICLTHKVNHQKIKQTGIFLKDLPDIPDIAFEKIKGKYLIAVYRKDFQTANRLANFLDN